MNAPLRILVSAALAAIASGAVWTPGAVAEDRQEPLPADLKGVEIVEHPDAQVPLDLRFVDESGGEVTLRDYFQHGRPVILTLNYYRCPMLCTLILNGLVQGMKDMPWVPGNQFEVVTVSIDPNETPNLARGKKKTYLEDYGKPEAEGGWHFLTGRQPDIRRLANAVGFGYAYIPERDEFAHGAAIFLLTPEGRISRTLYGVQFDGPTLRLALVEASQGRIGSVLDRFILYCYHYDATAGKYAPAALKIMQVGGGLTVLLLGSVLASLWLRELRHRPAA